MPSFVSPAKISVTLGGTLSIKNLYILVFSYSKSLESLRTFTFTYSKSLESLHTFAFTYSKSLEALYTLAFTYSKSLEALCTLAFTYSKSLEALGRVFGAFLHQPLQRSATVCKVTKEKIFIYTVFQAVMEPAEMQPFVKP